PTMLAALSDEQLARPRDVSSLRYLSHGGAPVATETLRRAHAAFPAAEMLHIYGATETAPIATLLPHEEQILDVPQARSCGRPAVGVEVGIRGLDGVWQTPDSIGEVVVRGPNVMAGYWNKPVEPAELMAHCRSLIAGYKIPKTIELREEPLPKSGAGKVLKRELREPHWRGVEARVAGA